MTMTAVDDEVDGGAAVTVRTAAAVVRAAPG
jgi:hypothetical protein